MNEAVRKPVVRIELEGGRVSDFSGRDRIRIGRSVEADFTIPDETISREHLVVLVKEDGIWIMDTGSSNGTFVNGHRMEPKSLFPHDPHNVITLGSQNACIRITAQSAVREPSLSLVPTPAIQEVHEPSFIPRPTESPSNEGMLPIQGSAALTPPSLSSSKIEKKLNDQIELLEADLQARKAAISEVQTLWQAALMDLNQARSERDKTLLEISQKAQELEDIQRNYEERKAELKEKIDSRTEKAEALLNEAKERFDSDLADLEDAFLKAKTEKESETEAALAALEQSLAQRTSEVQASIESLESNLSKISADFETEKERLETLLSKHQEDEKSAAQETRAIYKALEKAKAIEEERRREYELEQRKRSAIEETEAAERGMRLAQINRDIEEAITRLSRVENDRTRNEEAALSAKVRFDEARLGEEASRTAKEAHEKDAQTYRSDVERLSKRLNELSLEKTSLEDATQNALAIKERVEAELDSTRQTILEEKNRAERQIAQEEEESHARIQAEAEARLTAAEKKAKEIEKEARDGADAITLNARNAAKSAVDLAKSEAASIRENANSEAKRLVTEAAESARNKLAAHNDEIKASLEKHQREFVEMRAQMERERQELRKNSEHEITVSRANALTEARAQGESELHELQQKRRTEVQSIKKALEKATATQLKKSGLSAAEIARIVEEWTELGTIVDGILTPSASPEAAEELKRLGLVDPSSRLRAKKYWIRVGIVGSVIAIIALTFTIFRDDVNRVTASAVDQMKERSAESDAYVRQVQKERIAKAQYHPYQDNRFRETYTDNILFLKNYAEMTEDKDYQSKWVLEMNRWFQKEFEMNEKVIVQFAPIEASLHQELIKLRSYINPSFEKEGIDRMREAEVSAVEELRRILGSQARYRRFRVFQEHFFQKNAK
jgi:pSer/pThr/pTyr-binding forkhead associated (FHA) protein